MYGLYGMELRTAKRSLISDSPFAVCSTARQRLVTLVSELDRQSLHIARHLLKELPCVVEVGRV